MKVKLPYNMRQKEKKAMYKEIDKQILEREKEFSKDFDSTVLWTLHACFGFGRKRLKKFFDAFSEERRRLREYYQMKPEDTGWICRHHLKNIGVVLEDWYKESK